MHSLRESRIITSATDAMAHCMSCISPTAVVTATTGIMGVPKVTVRRRMELTGVIIASARRSWMFRMLRAGTAESLCWEREKLLWAVVTTFSRSLRSRHRLRCPGVGGATV